MKPESHRSNVKIVCLVLLSITWGLLGASAVLAATDEPVWNETTAASSETARIVGSANAFLATLDDAQRGKVLFNFNDEK